MAKNGTVAYVTEFPPCDVCKSEGRPTLATHDLRLPRWAGRWAFLCDTCIGQAFPDYPPRLGIGLGQRLEIPPDNVLALTKDSKGYRK